MSPVRYVSIGQADGVPPQYPDDPYYQHVEQGKRNPPSEHVLSYVSANIFSTIILHAVLNVNLCWIRVSYSCIKFPMPIPVFPPIIHRVVLLAEILTMLCCCLAMLS